MFLQAHILYSFSMTLRLLQYMLLRLSVYSYINDNLFLYYKPLLTAFIHYRLVYLISNNLDSIKLVLALFDSCLMVKEIRIVIGCGDYC